jgi:uncharacterized repeat protein (TIGR01451 family)
MFSTLSTQRSVAVSRTLVLVSLMGLAVALLVGIRPALATQPDSDGHKVTICHRTNSVTNPYTVNPVDYSSVDGALVHDNGNGDHTNHLGPVFDWNNPPSPPFNEDDWGDIIPPFSWEGDAQHAGGSYPGLNWTDAGQAIYNNGLCNGPVATSTPTPTGTPGATGTPAPTATPTPEGTPGSTATPKPGHPDTEISKSASVSSIMAGGSFDYTLTVVNDGSALATGVIVSDNLDNDLIINSVTPSKGSCGPVMAGNQFSCAIGDLEVDEVATVVVNVTAPAAACPSVDNRATVTAENELNDDQTLERSHSEIVVVEVVCETETATPTPVETATPTPEGSQAGSTGTPKASSTPEGSVGGSTGTPRPLPNTATEADSPSALIVLGFGLLLLGSIGSLSYASVAARRRNDR